MTNWNDYNNADEQQEYDIIPKGTLAKVRMTIKPGGYDDPAQGWTGGYATCGDTGAVYLNAEFVVLDGKYAKRKIWSLIGLHSPKGADWTNMGRSFVKGILNSARGLSAKDNSDKALSARRINSFADLDGIEFVAKIDVGKDVHGNPKNEIKLAITPDHKDYAAIIGQAAPAVNHQQPPQNPAAQPASNPNRPSWAQ